MDKSRIVKSDKKICFQAFPAVSKENFKVYHQTDDIDYYATNHRPISQPHSIYPTTSDSPYERKIVNCPKPQVDFRYLTIRGKQYRDKEARQVKRAKGVSIKKSTTVSSSGTTTTAT